MKIEGLALEHAVRAGHDRIFEACSYGPILRMEVLAGSRNERKASGGPEEYAASQRYDELNILRLDTP